MRTVFGKNFWRKLAWRFVKVIPKVCRLRSLFYSRSDSGYRVFACVIQSWFILGRFSNCLVYVVSIDRMILSGELGMTRKEGLLEK